MWTDSASSEPKNFCSRDLSNKTFSKTFAGVKVFEFAGEQGEVIWSRQYEECRWRRERRSECSR